MAEAGFEVVQIYTTNEPLEAKNVTYKGLIVVNKVLSI